MFWPFTTPTIFLVRISIFLSSILQLFMYLEYRRNRNGPVKVDSKITSQMKVHLQQSRVATTRKQMQFNFYDKFVSQKHVPEYVCTCCDQLRFKCSVVKCDPNKYKACSPDIVESCLTNRPFYSCYSVVIHGFISTLI